MMTFLEIFENEITEVYRGGSTRLSDVSTLSTVIHTSDLAALDNTSHLDDCTPSCEALVLSLPAAEANLPPGSAKTGEEKHRKDMEKQFEKHQKPHKCKVD